MAYDIRVSNTATYFSAFQWRHVYNIETNTNIHTYILHLYWDIWGRSMSNSSRWRVWILIRFTRWTVFKRSPSSEHLNPFKQINYTSGFFSTLLPRCLYPPTLVQVGFYRSSHPTCFTLRSKSSNASNVNFAGFIGVVLKVFNLPRFR